MNISPWHSFTIGSVLFSSIASLVVRRLKKNDKHDAVLSMVIFQFMLTLITFLIAYGKGFVFPFRFEFLPRMILSAVLYATGSLCNFYASKYLVSGEITILNAGGALITILLGVFIIGNTFTLFYAIGTGFILLAIWVLYARIRMKMNKGMWYVVSVSVSYAVAVINDVVKIRTYDPISFIPVMSFLPGLMITVVFYKRLSKMSILLKEKCSLIFSSIPFYMHCQR